MKQVQKLSLLIALCIALYSCTETPNTPSTPSVKPNPLKNATLLLTSKEGWNDGSRAFYRGHLMVLKQDGTFSQDMFAKANPTLKEKLLGFNTNSMMVVNNHIYTLSTQKHNDQAPLIHILDNKTLTLKKQIAIDPIVDEGIPVTVERLHVVSDQKAYLFFSGSIVKLDLSTGKLGKKLDNIDENIRIKYPFFELGGKIYALAFDEFERQLISIDTTTDEVAYTSTQETDDKEPIFIFRKNDNLISINKGFFGEWNLSIIDLTTQKATQTIDLPNKIGRAVTLHPNQPVIFFNGKYDPQNKKSEEKTLFRFNYETNTNDTFATLTTDRPKSPIYDVSLFVHPTTHELIAGVQDDVILKFVRTFDTATQQLPTTHKKEYLYDSKSTGVSEIVFNSSTTTSEK